MGCFRVFQYLLLSVFLLSSCKARHLHNRPHPIDHPLVALNSAGDFSVTTARLKEHQYLVFSSSFDQANLIKISVCDQEENCFPTMEKPLVVGQENYNLFVVGDVSRNEITPYNIYITPCYQEFNFFRKQNLSSVGLETESCLDEPIVNQIDLEPYKDKEILELFQKYQKLEEEKIAHRAPLHDAFSKILDQPSGQMDVDEKQDNPEARCKAYYRDDQSLNYHWCIVFSTT